MITEEFLQFIWEQGLFLKKGLRTTSGDTVRILHPGYRNIHAGPDFIHARIRIGRLLWAGNVEIHLHSASWKAHGHHLDPTYDNVILHVVHRFREEVRNSRGAPVYSCIISFTPLLTDRMEEVSGGKEMIPCGPLLNTVPAVLINRWIQQIAKERMTQKSDPLSRILSERSLSREEALFRAMARGFGYPVNTEPFDRLASGIPVSLIGRIRDNITWLEGVLFGQSGLMENSTCESPYVRSLLKYHGEFRAFCLNPPVPGYMWKFLRMRPASFPTLRVAQFASLIHQRSPFFPTLLETCSLTELEQFFRVRTSPFWETHYLFDKISSPSPRYVGFQSIHTLIINVVVPFLHAMGRTEKQPEYISRAITLLKELGTESNHIIKKWIIFGIKPRYASESQALIHLYHAYCRDKKCIQCSVGTFLLKTGHDKKL